MSQKENCHKGLVGKQSAKRTAFDFFLCYILLYTNMPSALEYYIPINNEKTDQFGAVLLADGKLPNHLKKY